MRAHDTDVLAKKTPPSLRGSTSIADSDLHTTDPDRFDQLSEEVAELMNNVIHSTLLSAPRFIEGSIQLLVARSSAAANIKATITGSTPITVEYRETYIPKPSDWLGASPVVKPIQRRVFPLNEIVTDFFRQTLAAHSGVRIKWPEQFPADLREAFDKANLQEIFNEQAQVYFRDPNVKTIALILTNVELQKILKTYLERSATTSSYRHLAEAYLDGALKPQLVLFQARTKVQLNQAVFLPDISDGTPTSGGLLVFLDEQQKNAVFELPADASSRRALIENHAGLQQQILARIPLYHRLKEGNEKVAYQRKFMKSIGAFQITPPLAFLPSANIAEELFALRRDRVMSDIDTLVSTNTERLDENLLALGGFIFQGLSIAATLPLGGSGLPLRSFISLLLGIAAASTDVIRGKLADLPDVADALFRSALINILSEAAGPLGERLLGKSLTSAAKSRLARTVEKLIAPKYKPFAIPPLTLGKQPISHFMLKRAELKLNAKLDGGPQTAQKMVTKTQRLISRVIQPYDITVYKGFVFRGDLRAPKTIFDEGFALRTPAEEIQRDIHQVTGVRGGFGGGHDALDPDGKGISTSAFYDRDNTGAFTYGGAKGGFTYVIDARKLDGYHLYANDFKARFPNAPPIEISPLEINYAESISALEILGAFDKNGVFIPNLPAIERSARLTAHKLHRKQLKKTSDKIIRKEIGNQRSEDLEPEANSDATKPGTT